MEVVFLKSRRRRPICLSGGRGEDSQQHLPLWWCDDCGMEVYGGGRLCPPCGMERSGNEKYGFQKRKSLQNLHPGT